MDLKAEILCIHLLNNVCFNNESEGVAATEWDCVFV